MLGAFFKARSSHRTNLRRVLRKRCVFVRDQTHICNIRNIHIYAQRDRKLCLQKAENKKREREIKEEKVEKMIEKREESGREIKGKIERSF